MNFFFGLFPHFPGHSWGNTGTGVRKLPQSPAERTPVLPGKYSSTSRKKLRYSPKRTCLILIQVDTFMSNNKMCFDYGKEEKSSKNK